MLVCLAFFVEKGGGKKKLTEFNKFMQTEIARLKEENPEMPHRERCVIPPPLYLAWCRARRLMIGSMYTGSSRSSRTGTRRRRKLERAARPPLRHIPVGAVTRMCVFFYGVGISLPDSTPPLRRRKTFAFSS